MTVPVLSGIARLAERYDGLILDLWGVLHDGRHPMPGALEALAHLREAGKRIVILSNAPRRATSVIRRITEIGIAPGLYDALLSSGEAAWQWLAAGKAPGPHLYPIMAARDGDMLAGVPAKAVQRIAEADFILNTGVESAADSVADFEEVLAAGVGRGLLMVCANPDLMVIHAGKPEICAGALALRYEELGGRVQYFGKPHAPIYDTCLGLLAIADRGRILAVGDSLRTDIAGARAAGIGSLLVLGGVHQEELTGGDLESVVRRAGVSPDAAVPSFRW